MASPVKLVVVEGDPEHAGQEIEIRGSEYVVGRAASCDLSIDHSRVSMQHCRLVIQADRLSVHDLRSTFGTSVNGEPVQSRELKDGDILTIGPLVAVVAIGDEASPARRRAYASLAKQKKRVEEAQAAVRGRDPNEDTPAVASARRIFESLAAPRSTKVEAENEPVDDESDDDDRQAGAGFNTITGGRRRSYLKVRKDESGICLIQLLDRSIIQDADILQINHELEVLIGQGCSRLILDFGNVKHLSSQALGILLQCQKRCKTGGGILKVCNPNPEVAEIFKIANLRRAIEIYADESQALASDWPEAVTPPSGVYTAAAATAASLKPVAPRPTLAEALERVTSVPPEVRLILEVGKAKGKAVVVSGPRFVIGRDPRCQLRPASEAISRVHTRIDQREGKVFVRDMGTTNGTLLGDRLLQGEEAEARDGDRLQIGPLQFTLQIKAAAVPVPRTSEEEDAAASWLFQCPEPAPGDTALLPIQPGKPASPSSQQRAMPADIRRIKTQIVGDALLVTLLSSELIDEEQIGPVRHELLLLLDQNLPRKVVVKLDRVQVMSSLAVAMIMSHFQRLDKLGGGLRLCDVRDEVFPALDSLLSAGVITVYPSAEQAIRDTWPIT